MTRLELLVAGDRDRKDGQRGGGVAVFVRHNVPCVRLPSLESANFEVVWL